MRSEIACLTIEKMPEGGFLVFEGRSASDPNRFCGPLFAATDIGEALNFIREKLLAGSGLNQARGAAIGGNFAGGVGACVATVVKAPPGHMTFATPSGPMTVPVASPSSGPPRPSSPPSHRPIG
ncbi:hypothetical protein [Bradyrhizobium retamae]|uniref:Uncharacterized protein n=1 Tax=Bradyrhizobium retamae TaxID=1300035 RepID=A0A0R3MP14_9BRAD|nr:hypothetical protein [Bradyrhizobium retamae]KRR21897.1 hypothetical protein CQ13_07630 [Bradyrhizobium retamae]